jgi:hypothetical protein
MSNDIQILDKIIEHLLIKSDEHDIIQTIDEDYKPFTIEVDDLKAIILEAGGDSWSLEKTVSECVDCQKSRYVLSDLLNYFKQKASELRGSYQI